MKEIEKVPFDSMPPLIRGSFLTNEQAEKLKEPFKDVVLVARCKDCKFSKPDWEKAVWCEREDCRRHENWFCADGEAKE